MLDFIMRLFGYEKIDDIKIPSNYKVPRIKKLVCKIGFLQKTGKYLDKVVINKEKMLLDGYTTLILKRWKEAKYIKVIEIDTTPELYNIKYKK